MNPSSESQLQTQRALRFHCQGLALSALAVAAPISLYILKGNISPLTVALSVLVLTLQWQGRRAKTRSQAALEALGRQSSRRR